MTISDRATLRVERKRLAESLFAKGVITPEGLEEMRSDGESAQADTNG